MLQNLLHFWKETANKGLRFHPDDFPVIKRYELNLPDRRIPEPWFGIPSAAKVFYLTLNPGHKPKDKSTQESWQRFCRDMMLERITYERYLKEAPPEAINWFRRNHGGFADYTFPNICNLRLIAYPSPDKSHLGFIGQNPQLLPSSKLMLKFVHSELLPKAKSGKILLLVMRSPTSWGFEKTDKDYWDGGFFMSRPLRASFISPNSRVGLKIKKFLGI